MPSSTAGCTPGAEVAVYPTLRADRQAAGVQDGSLNLPLNDEILVGDQDHAATKRRQRQMARQLCENQLAECIGNVREQGLRRVAPALAEVEIETRENHELS